MKDLLLKTYIRFKHDEKGVTLVEYGIALTLAVTFGVLALNALGGEIQGATTAAGNNMPG